MENIKFTEEFKKEALKKLEESEKLIRIKINLLEFDKLLNNKFTWTKLRKEHLVNLYKNSNKVCPHCNKNFDGTNVDIMFKDINKVIKDKEIKEDNIVLFCKPCREHLLAGVKKTSDKLIDAILTKIENNGYLS